jgi:hypothetical protein
MARLLERSFSPSGRARALTLELTAYAARVDGPVSLPEVAALGGAAKGLGAPERPAWPDALLLDEGRFLPPPLHELSAIERRVAFGAAAWMVHADGVESFVERAFLDFVADEAGLGPGEARALGAAAARARGACGEHLPRSVEFELLVLEVLSLHALGAGELVPPPAPDGPGPRGPEAGAGEVAAGGDGRGRWRRAS